MKKKLVRYLIITLPLLFLHSSYPSTLRVPSQYPTIQEAINTSHNGDTVLVAPGTYSGTNNYALSFLGKRIMVTSEAGFTVTIIDCQGLDRGCYFRSGEDSASILEGFTIQNGFAPSEEAGGGILCSDASPTIRNNFITLCEAYWGGGIGCLNASPIITNNSIIANHGERGGGIALLSSSNAIVRNNIISDNIASGG